MGLILIGNKYERCRLDAYLHSRAKEQVTNLCTLIDSVIVVISNQTITKSVLEIS